MEYTEGKWDVYLGQDGETRYITTRDKPSRPDKVIARMVSGLKEEEVNAHLIAAAPALYEALTNLTNRLTFQLHNNKIDMRKVFQGGFPHLIQAYEESCKALAKSEGG